MAFTTTKTLPAASMLGDFIKTIFHPAHNYDSGVITSPAAAVATPNVRLLGQPVSGSNGAYTLLATANIANATGFIADDNLHDLPVAAGTIPYKITVLVRGPAVVGQEGFPAADVNGGAITPAAAKTAANALGISVMAPLSPTKTQTN